MQPGAFLQMASLSYLLRNYNLLNAPCLQKDAPLCGVTRRHGDVWLLKCISPLEMLPMPLIPSSYQLLRKTFQGLPLSPAFRLLNRISKDCSLIKITAVEDLSLGDTHTRPDGGPRGGPNIKVRGGKPSNRTRVETKVPTLREQTTKRIEDPMALGLTWLNPPHPPACQYGITALVTEVLVSKPQWHFEHSISESVLPVILIGELNELSNKNRDAWVKSMQECRDNCKKKTKQNAA